MTRVYLGLGSNLDRRKHIRRALEALADQFGELICSPVFESEAVGFVGNRFFNLVVGIDTHLSVGELSACLKRIEDEQGRDRSIPKSGTRTLDIDILTYSETIGIVDGVRLPREEILHNAFVLWPLAEIAPREIHPVIHKTYACLWEEFDTTDQKLWPIDLDSDENG